MTILQLRYALTLQRFGNFKKAAKQLQISQPGLTLQIAKLEKEVGLMIFDRNQSPITVTPEGELFLTRAREIVVSSEELEKFATSLSDAVRGKLTIGIIPTLGPFLTPLFSRSMQSKFPDLSLDINEMITERVVDGVRQGELDVGIISTPVDIKGIRSVPVFYEKFFIYLSEKKKSSSITLKDIDYEKLWLLDEGNCFRDQINNFCDLKKIRKNKRFVYRSNSIDALVRIVDSQGGMTILPELTTLVLNEDQEEMAYPIDEKLPKAREIGLITRNRMNKENLVNELHKHIQECIPKHMLENTGLDVVDPNIRIT